MNQRERVIRSFNNESVDRTPVGFWYHFLPDDDFTNALDTPSTIERNIAGHREFISKFEPDLLKIMSDGFYYPLSKYYDINTANDLRKIKPLGRNHPWITKQTELVKTVVDMTDDTCGFYNIFSPAYFLQLALSDEKFFEFIKEDSAAVTNALDVIAEDVGDLVTSVIGQAGADGVYLCVQNNGRLSRADYHQYIAPSEQRVLARANELSPNNILHCCAFNEHKNELAIWQFYDAKVINWAVSIEDVSLKEGKELFGGKAILGGFDNRPNKLLCSGSKQQIQYETERLIRDANDNGVILGADCTLPMDIEIERLAWVRDAAIAVG